MSIKDISKWVFDPDGAYASFTEKRVEVEVWVNDDQTITVKVSDNSCSYDSIGENTSANIPVGVFIRLLNK